MNTVADERIDEHLDTVDLLSAEARINEVATSIPGLALIRVAEVRGQFSAVFEIAATPTSAKIFASRWYQSINELLSHVLDSLEHLTYVDRGDDSMNIFSADMFEYLSAEMLPVGKTVSLTITSVVQETVAGPRGEANKVIISFRERPKKLILNKTNARALAKFLGPETDNWRGATVALGVENVKVGRNTVPSIRVKSATPARGQAVPAQQGGDDERIDEREPQA